MISLVKIEATLENCETILRCVSDRVNSDEGQQKRSQSVGSVTQIWAVNIVQDTQSIRDHNQRIETEVLLSSSLLICIKQLRQIPHRAEDADNSPCPCA